MKDIALQIYMVGGIAAGAAVVTLLGLAVKRGIVEVGWERGRKVLLKAWDLIGTVTGEANAELHARLVDARDPDSPGGEKVTRAEWDDAVAKAVAKFKRLWGLGTLAELAAAVGIELDFLDDWIGAAVTSGVKVPTTATTSAALDPP